ncbi:hypothetical protein BDB01DRAFT_857029 [Pilobolus umbonatus]|nr:hypothetical protein BDB01DRAFT_857029 [Pilobolus umbonatus]
MINFRHLTPLDFENSSSQQRQGSISNDDNSVDTLLSEESVLSIYSSDEEIVISATGNERYLLIDEVEETIINYYNDEHTINEDYIDQMKKDVVETSNDIIEIVEDVLEVEEEDLIYMDAIDDIEDNNWNRTVEVPLMTTRQLFSTIASEDTTIRYLYENGALYRSDTIFRCPGGTVMTLNINDRWRISHILFDWYQMIREDCKIGGINEDGSPIVVEIDESKFGKENTIEVTGLLVALRIPRQENASLL